MSRLLRFVLSELGVGHFNLRLFVLNGLLTLLPARTFTRTRRLLYRLFGYRIGADTLVYGKLFLWGGPGIEKRLTVGKRCRLNSPVYLDLNAPVTIGDDVVIALNVTIVTATHKMNDPAVRCGELILKPVTIGNGAWVATGATILPGVTIGEGAVVGANSLVTRDVPPHTLVAGSPAQPVRTLPGAPSQTA